MFEWALFSSSVDVRRYNNTAVRMKTLQFCLLPFSLSFTEVPSIFLFIVKHFVHGQSVSDTESNTIPRFEINRLIVWMIDIFIYRSFGVYDWFATFELVMSFSIKQLLEWLSSCLGFNSRFYSHKLDSRNLSRLRLFTMFQKLCLTRSTIATIITAINAGFRSSVWLPWPPEHI